MRLKRLSAIKTLPAESTPTDDGRFRNAAVGLTLSGPGEPAYALIVPGLPGVIMRTMFPAQSATYRFPPPSITIPSTRVNFAPVAGPPSPLYPKPPFPANVVTNLVDISIRRTRNWLVSV